MTEETGIDQNINEARKYLEETLGEAQKERKTNLAKTIGWSAVPLATLAGISGLGVLLTYPFQNQDLKYLVSMGIGLGLGGLAGSTGLVQEWYEQLKDQFDDLRDSYREVSYLKKGQRLLENF